MFQLKRQLYKKMALSKIFIIKNIKSKNLSFKTNKFFLHMLKQPKDFTKNFRNKI